MTRILRFLLFFLIFFSLLTIASSVASVFAQSSVSCWLTQIGTPPGEKPTLPAECSSGGSGVAPGVPPGSVDGACTPTGAYPENLRKELFDKYNVTVDQSYTDEHVKNIYELFICLSGTRFPSLVGNTSIINGTTFIDGVGETIGMGCGSGFCNIYITEMPGRPTTFKFLLTHEFGHVISYNNLREVTLKTEFENIWAEENGISAYSRRNGESGCNGGASMEEDYAETVAYFLHPNAGETTGACNADEDKSNPLYTTSKYPRHIELIRKVL